MMKKDLKKKIHKHRVYYLLLLPAVIYYIIFHYIPMGGIVIAFKDYSFFKGFNESPWVGFQWFKYLITAPGFMRSFRNTLLISLYILIFNFPAPIILALMLNECEQVKFKRVVQTVSYLPHFLSWATIAGLMVVLLSPSVGLVNQLIKMIGREPIYFMAEPKYTRSLFVISSLWKGTGWGSIIYLAAMTNIDPQLYEAATIDGAGKLKQIWYITIPGISSLIIMMLVFNSANLINVGFEQAYNLVIPTTYETGQVTSTYVYAKGLQEMKYSFGTAVGLTQSIISIVLLTTANTIAKKIDEDGAIW